MYRFIDGKCKPCFIFKQVVSDNFNHTGVNDSQKPLDFASIFTTLLDKIVTSLSCEDLKATLLVMSKIFDDIIRHPNDDKYCEIKLANKTFSSKVWSYPACEEFMKMSGWIVEDDHVRLQNDSHVRTVHQLLESLCRQTDVNLPLLSNRIAKYSEHEYETITSAVVSGNISEIQNLLKPFSISTAGVIYCESDLSTNLLHSAILSQKIDVVELLVKKYSVNPYVANNDDDCEMVFKVFISAPQTFIIEFLKCCEVKSFLKDVGNASTLFLYAITSCCFKVICFLVKECGVDVNVCDENLNTPLHYAYLYGQTDIAQYLIQNGADVMAVNCEGKTPYDYIDGEPEAIAFSQSMRNHRIIHQVPGSAEYMYFIELHNKGTKIEEAITLTMQQFPSLTEDGPTQPHRDVDRTSFTKELTQYITKISSANQPWELLKPERLGRLGFRYSIL